MITKQEFKNALIENLKELVTEEGSIFMPALRLSKELPLTEEELKRDPYGLWGWLFLWMSLSGIPVGILSGSHRLGG